MSQVVGSHEGGGQVEDMEASDHISRIWEAVKGYLTTGLR